MHQYVYLSLRKYTGRILELQIAENRTKQVVMVIKKTQLSMNKQNLTITPTIQITRGKERDRSKESTKNGDLGECTEKELEK